MTSGPAAEHALPRAGLLRDLTDTTVLDRVFALGRVTRAELAAITGISKPTISESVRRLSARDILVETGLQTGRRGRMATFYELAATAGWVLAVEVDPDGISSSASGLTGETFGEVFRPTPSDAKGLLSTLKSIISRQRRSAHEHGPLRVLSVSVANPVDPNHRDIVALPFSPLPDGLTSLRSAFEGLDGTALLLENDVNLAALAERHSGVATEASSFGYLFLGGGIGFASYLGDQLIRGARGLAGEITFLPTGSVPSATVLEALVRQGFGRADGLALDVASIRSVLDLARAGDPAARQRVDGVCQTLLGVIGAVHAVTDPEIVVLGGSWGRHPWLIERLRAAVDTMSPLSATIMPGSVQGSASLHGATIRAIAEGRRLLIRDCTGRP